MGQVGGSALGWCWVPLALGFDGGWLLLLFKMRKGWKKSCMKKSCMCFFLIVLYGVCFWRDVGVGARNVYVELERTEYVCRYVMYIVSFNIHIYIVYLFIYIH